MRRFVCFVSIFVILCCCSLPAFATGNVDGAGNVIYAPLVFDEWYSDMGGGPYEWPGNYYRQSAYTEAFSFGDNTFYGTITVGSNGNMSLDFTNPGENFTLVANNEFMRLNYASDQYLGCSNARFKKVRFYGAYVAATRDAQGQVILQRYNFDYTYQMGAEILYSVPIGQWLDEVVEEKYGYNPNGMFFEKLSIDFAIERDSVSTPRFSYYVNRDRGSTIVYDFRSWVNLELKKFNTDPQPPIEGGFEVGSFLGTSVSAFMNTGIWGDFTFGHLLGISLTLGLLFFVLRMLV